MSLRSHYILDEDEIRGKLFHMVSTYRFDVALKKVYKEADGTRGRSFCCNDRELLILMDTSALMETPSSEIFISKTAPALLRRKQKLVIPISVMGELKNIADTKSGRSQGINAGKMLEFVMEYWRRGVISIYDNQGAGGIFADELFQVLAVGFARDYRVIVISQDYLLGQDLLTICRLPSVKGREISIRKLTPKGNIERVEWNGASYLSDDTKKLHRQKH